MLVKSLAGLDIKVGGHLPGGLVVVVVVVVTLQASLVVMVVVVVGVVDESPSCTVYICGGGSGGGDSGHPDGSLDWLVIDGWWLVEVGEVAKAWNIPDWD